MSDPTGLLEAILTGATPAFDPITGAAGGAPEFRSTGQRLSAALGLEPPRFCQICGRRMVVQVTPSGWAARCARHGSIDSTLFER